MDIIRRKLMLVSGISREGAWPHPIFLFFFVFETGHSRYLRVWMTGPPPYLNVWIRHWLVTIGT